MNPERAVVLLSGGLDSTTVTAIASSKGMELHTLTFRYGQKHSIEMEMAARTALRYGARHLKVDLDPEPFRGSALTGSGELPRGGTSKGIPNTYVPARNTVFLSIALAVAESRRARHVFIGVNAVDYSGYPDCRPEFIDAFQKLADVATRDALNGVPCLIHAPLLTMTKAEIIRTGLDLGVDYGDTVSCYSPDGSGRSCGTCDSCLLRLRAFQEVGVKDPAPYV